MELTNYKIEKLPTQNNKLLLANLELYIREGWILVNTFPSKYADSMNGIFKRYE